MDKQLLKHRNFFAHLLEEENGKFAYELQEIYNIICTVLREKNSSKKRNMLLNVKWLIESKNLQSFLIKKGYKKI